MTSISSLLLSNFFTQRQQLNQTIIEIERVIFKRIDYILSVIEQVYDSKTDLFGFNEDGSQEVKDINEEYGIHFDHYMWGDYSDSCSPCFYYDKNNNLINLTQGDKGIPVNWLFEDFEEELKTGYQKYLISIKKE